MSFDNGNKFYGLSAKGAYARFPGSQGHITSRHLFRTRDEANAHTAEFLKFCCSEGKLDSLDIASTQVYVVEYCLFEKQAS